MRIETPMDRAARQLRAAAIKEDAAKQILEAKEAGMRMDDGFLWLCEENHREAMEREAAFHAEIVPAKAPKVQKNQTIRQSTEERMMGFVSGVSTGAVATLLIVWILLLAARVI